MALGSREDLGMNGSAIQKLRHKFILVATLSFFVVIVLMGAATAFANYATMRSQASTVIDIIIENGGILPEPEDENTEHVFVNGKDAVPSEFFYSARYFSVVLDKEGHPRAVNIERIATVNESDAITYAQQAPKPVFGLGRIDSFFYSRAPVSDDSTISVFLDYSTQMQINNEVLRTTMLICGASLVITFVVVVLVSSVAVRPEIENARRQRQFITNASHELKTPLAVIRANTEVIEMLQGESEWTQSTRRQVDRMDGLVQNLVMVARARERESKDGMGEIDVTRVVGASVEPFQALAVQDQLELVADLEEDVRMVARESAIQQLVTLLVDNAIKYCDPGGSVRVALSAPRKGRQIQIEVSNSYAAGDTIDYSRFFERFYRNDEAHSNQGGYGIGLSVAESICDRYRGSIKASWKDGDITFTCLLRSM